MLGFSWSWNFSLIFPLFQMCFGHHRRDLEDRAFILFIYFFESSTPFQAEPGMKNEESPRSLHWQAKQIEACNFEPKPTWHTFTNVSSSRPQVEGGSREVGQKRRNGETSQNWKPLMSLSLLLILVLSLSLSLSLVPPAGQGSHLPRSLSCLSTWY